MPTWTGWENQFLNAANIIITPPNRTFMDEWASHAPGSCRNNPIDLTFQVQNSTRCGSTVGGFGRTQNYDTHAHAAQAFADQMRADWTQPLLAALNSGNPFQIDNKAPVVAVLNRWASPSFATWYKNANTDGTSGGGGSGGGGSNSHAHKAWADLTKSLDSRLHNRMSNSRRTRAAALRRLQHARKVIK